MAKLKLDITSDMNLFELTKTAWYPALFICWTTSSIKSVDVELLNSKVLIVLSNKSFIELNKSLLSSNTLASFNLFSTFFITILDVTIGSVKW